MTLILTAYCRNGICVCADTRYKIRDGSNVRCEDGHKKIYKFKDIPLIILNHGLNRFTGKDWNDFCREYELSNRWKDKSIEQISVDFKNFVESVVDQELRKSVGRAPAAGFLLCGKSPEDADFRIFELFWRFDPSGLHFSSEEKHGIAMSGDGKDYLKGILRMGSKYNDINFWRNNSKNRTKSELIKLFGIAITRQKSVGGDEFSDNFDIDWVCE